jgi:uncharacterized protein (TIGR04255 family)
MTNINVGPQSKYPIVETVFELRFQPVKMSVSEIIPGLIYSEFSQNYPRVHKLPLANFPTVLIEQDPNLIFQPTVLFQGDKKSILTGNLAICLSCLAPCQGWEMFAAEINHLISAFQKTELAQTLERFSLKFLNMPETSDKAGISSLKLKASLDGIYNFTTEPIDFKVQIAEDEMTSNLNIVYPASISMPFEIDKKSSQFFSQWTLLKQYQTTKTHMGSYQKI